MKDYFARTRIGTPRPPQEQKPCPPEEWLVDYPPEDFSRAPMQSRYWERDSKGHISDGFLKDQLPHSGD